MPYEHIKISRDEPIVPRLTRRLGPQPRFTVDEAKAYGVGLKRSLEGVKTSIAESEIAGYDDRLLFKVKPSRRRIAARVGSDRRADYRQPRRKIRIAGVCNDSGLRRV